MVATCANGLNAPAAVELASKRAGYSAAATPASTKEPKASQDKAVGPQRRPTRNIGIRTRATGPDSTKRIAAANTNRIGTEGPAHHADRV